MADAQMINRWMKSTLLALRGAVDSCEHAIAIGDTESAAILVAVANGFAEPPLHAFMTAVPGWNEEVERCRSLSGAVNPAPLDPDEVQVWSETYWTAGERQAITSESVERMRARRGGR